jgi:hypothetical protein
MTPELLKELGLDKASDTLTKKISLKRKLLIAYEHYRFVEPHIFDRFQEEIKAKTLKKKDGWYDSYDQLVFIPIKEYGEVPPPDCLLDLRKAKEMNCFDTFEVAKVQTVEHRPDPIIFGCIEGCVDKFFITQWDDDVSIEQILKDSEG